MSERQRLIVLSEDQDDQRQLEITEDTHLTGTLVKPTWIKSFKFLLLESKINLFLLFILPAVIIPNTHWPESKEFQKALIIFILNFLAIIPLSQLLGTATEEIALQTSPVVGGLLNATFGNAVELIIAVIALEAGLVRIVQASLLGSILSNLLLVLGFCFLLGGCKFETQRFNVDSAQTAASMLALAVTGVMIPACFDLTAGTNHDSAGLALSRGTSVILLVMYLLYLIFQLKTHAHLYSGDGEGGGGSLEEIAQMSVSASIVTLIVVTMIVSVCAEFLVDSIKVVSEGTGWSETFIGLIIVPIVGNAAEHMTAVTVAMKDKMDLALAVAIGSSMQVALLLTPVACLAGWIMDKPMSLDFQAFETMTLFVTMLIVNYLIMDGKSHWLEGALLLALYAIIALAFFLYPK